MNVYHSSQTMNSNRQSSINRMRVSLDDHLIEQESTRVGEHQDIQDGFDQMLREEALLLKFYLPPKNKNKDRENQNICPKNHGHGDDSARKTEPNSSTDKSEEVNTRIKRKESVDQVSAESAQSKRIKNYYCGESIQAKK